MKRKNIPLKIQILVFERDNWHCRYCEKPVFFAKALKLLDELNPHHEYFHPNGKTGAMLPLFQWSWATVDHITPASKEGKDALENYVTACWKCNLKYREKTEAQGKPKPKDKKESKWDGFYGLYKILLKQNTP